MRNEKTESTGIWDMCFSTNLITLYFHRSDSDENEDEEEEDDDVGSTNREYLNGKHI